MNRSTRITLKKGEEPMEHNVDRSVVSMNLPTPKKIPWRAPSKKVAWIK